MTPKELVGEINKAVTRIDNLKTELNQPEGAMFVDRKLEDIMDILSNAADKEFKEREIAKHLPGCNDYIDYVSVFKDIVEARKYWDTDSPLYYLARATEKLLDIVKANGKG